MDMTEACNDNLKITSDCPIPNVCKTLSPSRPNKPELADVSVNDMPRVRGSSTIKKTKPADDFSDGQPITEIPRVSENYETHGYGNNPVIRTDPDDSALSEDQLVKGKSDISVNSSRHDLLEDSEPIDLMENHRNVIAQTNETRNFVSSGIYVGHNPFDCNICDMKFSHPYFLAEHKRSHSAEKPFVCDICDERFSLSTCLIKHRRLHTPGKVYVCDICDKSFGKACNFVIHKRFHTGERPFVCEFCDKRFVQSSDLVRHKRSHTGEKPFVCDLCGKSFSESSNLSQHERSHTGAQNFICDVCGKSFSGSAGLRKHKRSHSDEKSFDCDLCGKSFLKGCDLIRHKRTHTGEKPFVCDFCERRFTHSSNLKRHQRTHTGQSQIFESLPLTKPTTPEFGGTHVPVE